MKILLNMLLLSVVVVSAGCSGGKKSQTVMPAELPELASQFKAAKPSEAKIEIAKKLQPVLPTCLRESGDGMAVIEYDNPTYKLTLTELYALLGTPEEITPQFVAYDLGKDAKATYYLLIQIYDDYVSAAQIDVGK